MDLGIHYDYQKESDTSEVAAELNRIHEKHRGSSKKLVIFLATLFISVLVGKIWISWQGILILAVVVLIHELGHFCAMKIFRYHDPCIFFIPLFGAATSGTESNPSGKHQAVVSLMGPLPGLMIGLIFCGAYLFFDRMIFFQIGGLFLLINGFNLLPFYPLDGGRFLDAVLFSRNKIMETGFKFLMTLIPFICAVYFKAWIIAAFTLLVMISLNTSRKIANIAADLKKSRQFKPQDGIPEDTLKYILDQWQEKWPLSVHKPKRLAKFANIIWKKACLIPPSGKATFLLLMIYVMSLSLPVVITAAYFPFEKTIETYQKDDGSTGQRELTLFLDQVISRIDVSEENLYHGTAEHFLFDRVTRKGEYFKGKWHGEWSYYDRNGKLIRTQLFDKGRLIVEKRLGRNGWKELTMDDLSSREKAIYQKHEKGDPLGPDTKK